MSKLTVLCIALGCTSAFLIQDFKYNQTTSQTTHGQHASVEDNIRDLMTLITEEKRLRFQLEDRVNAAENKINKMEQYNIAVSNELEKEKNKVEQLETLYYNVTRELKNITANFCECKGEHEFENIQSRVENLTVEISILKSAEGKLQEETSKFNITLMDKIMAISRQMQLANASRRWDDIIMLKNETIALNRTLQETIINTEMLINIANASVGLDDIRSLRNETRQLKRTIDETVMNAEWKMQIANRSLKSINNESVGFSVSKPDISSGSGPLMFKLQAYNDHNAYNLTSGMFECSIPGLYFFTLSIFRSTSTKTGHCYCIKNGRAGNYAYTFASSNSAEFATATNSILYYLQTGDKVFITGCGIIGHLASETSFTGFLVSQPYKE